MYIGHLIDRVFTYRSPVLREQRSEQPLYDLLSHCRLTDCASKRSASAALELKKYNRNSNDNSSKHFWLLAVYTSKELFSYKLIDI